MSKVLLVLVAVVGIIGISVVLLRSNDTMSPQVVETAMETPAAEEQMEAPDGGRLPAGAMSPESFSVVPAGSYTVVPEESTVNWAGQKPLIDGYVNRGAIAVSEGSIEVTDAAASGSFTIDMTTLSVSETPTKPGQESALEGHLKGERWFDATNYPTATFTISEVTPQPDSEVTFTYDVTGSLTMRGVTNEISFPATIYLDDLGQVVATADFEIDRTRWGIEAGSASFFDNLADNVVADEVAISFRLVATEG